jgi:hypothetical protein
MADTRTFTCPTPQNINPLSPVGYQFNVTKLPDLSFFAQEVNLPGITLGEPEFGTPFARIPIPGETLQYEQLQLTFLVDEGMKNYRSIYNWMIALGFPQSYDQYITLASDDTVNYSELATNYSDATLLILNNNNMANQVVSFKDVFPVALDSLQFSSTQNDVQYLMGRVSFRFSYYNFL